jgi:hypothetical protein
MFKKIFTETIENTALKAVEYAEDIIGKGKGTQKKQVAIAYIIGKLPVPVPFKSLLSMILMELIEESIEFALKKMKNIKEVDFSV